ELPLLDYACQYLLARTQTRFDEILREFPNRWVAFKLRCCILPNCWREHEPNQRLQHAIAQLLSTPSDTRTHLVASIDHSDAESNPIHLLYT
ncbi:acyl-CoA dehydrogenase domain-containing protein, partial [Acinetobacter baumannii]